MMLTSVCHSYLSIADQLLYHDRPLMPSAVHLGNFSDCLQICFSSDLAPTAARRRASSEADPGRAEATDPKGAGGLARVRLTSPPSETLERRRPGSLRFPGRESARGEGPGSRLHRGGARAPEGTATQEGRGPEGSHEPPEGHGSPAGGKPWSRDGPPDLLVLRGEGRESRGTARGQGLGNEHGRPGGAKP
jgi:hypothetical protein